MNHRWGLGLVVLACTCSAACALFESPYSGLLPPGTWGGDNAGMIVTDSGAHLHIGCTIGEVRAVIPLDDQGRFDVPESHNITAHPVDRGIFLPARLTGRADGRQLALTLTVTIDDTVRHETVVLGPVRLRWGAKPEMGPCPICRTPPE